MCLFVFRFKLDQQAKFIERVQNVEVREAKVKGRSELLILSYHTVSGHYYCCLLFLMPGQLFLVNWYQGESRHMLGMMCIDLVW